jgi:hypothetical protein
MSPAAIRDDTAPGIPGGVGGDGSADDGELTRLEARRDLDQKRLTTEATGQLLGSSGSECQSAAAMKHRGLSC